MRVIVYLDQATIQIINAASSMEERMENGCPTNFRRYADQVVTAAMAGDEVKLGKLKKKLAGQIKQLPRDARKVARF